MATEKDKYVRRLFLPATGSRKKPSSARSGAAGLKPAINPVLLRVILVLALAVITVFFGLPHAGVL